MIQGYGHHQYALCLSEFGEPIYLDRCNGWILKQKIPETNLFDGRGCYPLFTCEKWNRLEEDLSNIKDLICVYMVLDPFGDYTIEQLNEWFHVVIPFKHHYILYLNKEYKNSISKHHKRNINKSYKNLEIEFCRKPLIYLDSWIELYSTLIVRHNIKGIAQFSYNYFKKLFQVPGLYTFKAQHKNNIVGMLLWLVNRNIAYYHLGAFSPMGYKLYASFGLFAFSIDFFKARSIHILNFGGCAGLKDNPHDGLARFKRGWANATKTAYFCGRIINKSSYDFLCNKNRGRYSNNFFPTYRSNNRH